MEDLSYCYLFLHICDKIFENYYASIEQLNKKISIQLENNFLKTLFKTVFNSIKKNKYFIKTVMFIIINCCTYLYIHTTKYLFDTPTSVSITQ